MKRGGIHGKNWKFADRDCNDGDDLVLFPFFTILIVPEGNQVIREGRMRMRMRKETLEKIYISNQTQYLTRPPNPHPTSPLFPQKP